MTLAALVFGLAFAGPPATPSPAAAPSATPTPPDGAAPPAAEAAPAREGEGCLDCHRYPGLSRIDHETGELRLFFTDERYYADAEGPHARLECTQCHTDAGFGKVPHEDHLQPVDCTQTCHLVTSAGAPVRFSHEPVELALEQSVHRAQALGELPYARSPLREGQASCLYCHDEPVFVEIGDAGHTHRGMDDTTRCATCHDEELSVDVDYFVKHTAARLESARPILQSAQVCATCHSDAALEEAMGQHDAVTSYLHSFHGKATLHGSTETATCVDCHRSETGNVHAMRSKEDPESLTHEARLGLTCRTAECHPNAAPEITGAAVHLRLDPDVRAPEYLLVAAFVMLIAFELSTYFGLALLELLNTVLRRESHEEHRRVALVDAIRESARGQRLLRRMTIGQRLQHWGLVITFTLLVLTGMPMRFASHPISHWIAELFGGIAPLRVLHRVSGVGLFLVFGLHVIYLGVKGGAAIRAHRAEHPGDGLFATLKAVGLGFPMVPTLTDLKQFHQMYMYLLGLRKDRPHRGQFHFSQKIEYWAVFWGMVIIGLSGLMMWGVEWVPGWVGGRALNFAIIVHSYEAFLAMMYIVIAHLYAVILAPSVFPLSLAAITGQMPAHEMAENHIGHLEDVARQMGIDPESVAETRHGGFFGQLLKRVYALVLVVPVAVLGFLSMAYLVDQTLGRRAGIDLEALPLRLDESTLVEAAGGAKNGAEKGARYQRGPLAHYHLIPTWYRPDAGNGCAGSGCHDSLPHGLEKEDRAFLNMHSTFVDCQVCHLEGGAPRAELSWVSRDADRAARPAPAVMRLAARLAAPSPDPEAEKAELLALLADAITESGGDRELVKWQLNLETTRVGGPMYSLYVDDMRRRIHLHGHGQFGAKIGLPGRRWIADAEAVAAARSLRAGAAESEREGLVKASHPGVVRPEVQCRRCHDDKPEAIDFEALGYAPDRAAALRSTTIVRQSESVESGGTFYIPALVPPAEPTP